MGEGDMRKAFAVLHRLLAPVVLVAAAVPGVQALEKPTPEEIERYRRDGSLAERLQRAYALGNHKVRPGLAADAAYRLRLELWRQGRISERPLPPPGWQGMPTKGNVKVFALLVSFADYSPTNTPASIAGKLFGNGSGTPPYESVRNFYRRSSYYQLEIGGTTLGWYRTAYPRSSVTDPEALIEEALSSFDAGHDFAQYDNDGDGYIDYFLVIWTGPHTGWGSLWWAWYTYGFGDSSFTVDGKRLGGYSWQWESNPVGRAFNPGPAIHETGHALGLPDYYDYDVTVGPQGGVGYLDMMDGNWGDHNCFSKFLLDWLTPTVVAGGANAISLRSAGSYGDAVLFAKGATGDSFAEYFMVQNRTRTGNDTTYPTDGLLVWHVDAQLDQWGYNYVYNNSSTAHKLLRLMEADGLEEIETTPPYGGVADAGDYYVAGRTIDPWTHPSLARYDFGANPLRLHGISAAGSPMGAHLDEILDATGPTGAPGTPTDEGATTTRDRLVFTWTQGSAADPETGILGYHLQVGTTPGGSDIFDGPVGPVLTKTVTGARDGHFYYARVRALNGVGTAGAWSGDSDGIFVDFPRLSCTALDNCGLVFKTAGDATWLEQSAVVYYGSTAAQAGHVADNQASYLQTTLVGPGTLGFWWKVSSEYWYDRLQVLLDGETQTWIYGDTAWAPMSLYVPAGTHVVEWRYEKDYVWSSGSDTGWVDRVEWTGPALPLVSIDDVTLIEPDSGTTTADFTVTLSVASTSPVTVDYATADVSATAGSDYVAASGTLTFAPGETSKTIPVTINGDTTPEPGESFNVNLFGASGAAIADAQGLGTITRPTGFYTVTPCRVLDSRQATGPWGGAPLAARQERSVTVAGVCGIPATALAVSLNVTAVNATSTGHLRIFPAGTPKPGSSSLNFVAGKTRGNNAVVGLGSGGALAIFSGQQAGSVHVVVDVNGWYE
jgi:M6 family metalloprotease-like protein